MNRAQAVSIIIVFALLSVAIAVQPAAANPGTRLESVIAFMDEQYDDDDEGGYSKIDSETSWIEATYAGVLLLDFRQQLDVRPPVINITKTKNFVQKAQWEGGGEDHERYGGFSAFLAGPTNIRLSYKAIKTWELIVEHEQYIPGIDEIEFNETAALVYVNKTQTDAGGFGLQTGYSPDIVSTHYALYVMDYLLENSPELEETWFWNRTATVDWILSCQDENGFKLNPNSGVIGVTPTAAALLALDTLDELDRVSFDDRQDMLDWILDRQTMETLTSGFYGGFEETAGSNDTNLMSTYFALQAISLLDGFDNVDTEAAIDFVLSCQAADGSWGTAPGLESGATRFVAEALLSLTMLGEDYFGTINEIDPNNPPAPLIDWRLVVFIGIIVVALVVSILSVRRD